MDDELKSNITSGNSNVVSKATFVDVSWTELDTATGALTIASSFIPGFSLLASIGQLILGVGKGSMEAKQLNAYIETFRSKLPDIKSNLLMELRSSYRLISEYAHKQLDEGYKQQIQASLDAVKQAQNISQLDELSKEEIKEGLEIAEYFIDSAHKRLAELENKLVLQ